MTPTEMINRAYKGIEKQGEFGMDGVGCSYFTSGGLTCAIGVLLTDNDMRRRWEAEAWTGSFIADKLQAHPPQLLEDLKTTGLDQVPRSLIYELQVEHDTCARENDITDFRRSCDILLEKYA